MPEKYLILAARVIKDVNGILRCSIAFTYIGSKDDGYSMLQRKILY